MKQIFTTLFAIIVCTTMTVAQLVITEISYNPPEADTDSLEYIELYNAGSTTLNLEKYKFTQGIVFTFPNISIGAGQYLLLTVNDTAFFNVYGMNTLQWESGALSNSGESIAIVDSMSNPVISMTFSDKAPWPTVDDGTDAGGKSIEICNPLADPNNGESWKVSTNNLNIVLNGKDLYGTPGVANSIPTCSQEPDVNVAVSSNIFTPRDITIDVGQTVRWENFGGNHNVNGSQSVFPNNPESFGNGAASNTAWTFDYTFNIEGFYEYQCDPHAGLGMKGTVTVKGPVVVEPYPMYDITDVTTTNADGVVDSLNVTCALKGIVYGVNLRPAGLQFTIIDDQNNGIGVFSASSNFDYTVVEGDEVLVKGQIAQFNGFAQIAVNSISKLSAGNTLVNSKEVTSFVEEDESSLITIGYVSFVDPSQWTGAGAGFNVTMANSNGDNFQIRIDNDIDAFAGAIPSSSTSWFVTGLLGQFDNAAPYDAGYQLLPRYLVDFDPAGSANDTELDANIKATPNPVSNVLTIETTSNPELLQVYDQNGKLMLSTTNTNQIDMSLYPSGMYSLKLVKANKASTIRVVKL